MVSPFQVDSERLRERYQHMEEFVALKLDESRSSPLALGPLFSRAYACAGWLAAIEPSSPRLAELVKLLAQIGAALFKLVWQNEGDPADFTLNGERVRLAGHVDQSVANPRRWLDATAAAIVARDQASRELLRTSWVEKLDAPDGLPHLMPFASALRAYLSRSWAQAKDHLEAALQASDPAALEPDAAQVALQLDVPAMKMLYLLLRDEPAQAVAELPRGIDRHRAYWTRTGQQEEGESFLALVPFALAQLADEETPGALGAAAFRPALASAHDPVTLLCPYCLAPVPPSPARCPSCRREQGRDALVEVSAADLPPAETKACGHCGTMVAKLAVTCPACRRPV